MSIDDHLAANSCVTRDQSPVYHQGSIPKLSLTA